MESRGNSNSVCQKIDWALFFDFPKMGLFGWLERENHHLQTLK
jgi:hypothetical protein